MAVAFTLDRELTAATPAHSFVHTPGKGTTHALVATYCGCDPLVMRPGEKAECPHWRAEYVDGRVSVVPA